MRFQKRMYLPGTVLVCLFVLCLFMGCGDKDGKVLSFTLLQTSDLHSHASGYGPFADYTPYDTKDNDSVRGGYARLAKAIKEIRSQQQATGVPVLLVDSGDFFMGTVYDLASSTPVSLNFFNALGYDAITLGNHEFDWGTQGLALLVSNALNNEAFSVPILASNMVTNSSSTDDDALEALVGADVILSKKVLTLDNGLKIGLLGLNGPDSVSKMSGAGPLSFETDYSQIQAMVDDLRNNDQVDLVVVLSHGGIALDGTGDDADLARNVSGIDIIASGHYHTATQKVFEVGPNKTLVFSPGAYGQWLSRLDVDYNLKTKEIVYHHFELLPIDDQVGGDADIGGLVEDANTALSATLAQLGMPGLSDTVTQTSFDLDIAPYSESGLGDLCADAVRFTANSIAAATGDTNFALGVVASGVIRDALQKGKTGILTFSDVYNVLPLGISPWDSSVPGYPLMSIYVTGAEVRNACEVSASIARTLGEDFYLNFSGIRYKYDPQAAAGQMVREIYLCPSDDYATQGAGELVDLTDNATLYRVVVDYYALIMMNYATSMGLPIVPKDKNGQPIDSENYAAYRIDTAPATEGVQELKEWASLLSYLTYLNGLYDNQIPESLYGQGGSALGRAGEF